MVLFVWTLRRGLLLRNLEDLCVWVGGVLPLVLLQTSLFSFIPSPAWLVPPSLFLLVLVYLVSSPPFAPPLRTRVVPPRGNLQTRCSVDELWSLPAEQGEGWLW